MLKNASGEDPILNSYANMLGDGGTSQNLSLDITSNSQLPKSLSQESLHIHNRGAPYAVGEYGLLRRDNEASWSQP